MLNRDLYRWIWNIFQTRFYSILFSSVYSLKAKEVQKENNFFTYIQWNKVQNRNQWGEQTLLNLHVVILLTLYQWKTWFLKILGIWSRTICSLHEESLRNLCNSLHSNINWILSPFWFQFIIYNIVDFVLHCTTYPIQLACDESFGVFSFWWHKTKLRRDNYVKIYMFIFDENLL